MILLISVVLPCWPKHRDRSSAPGTTRRSIVPSGPALEVPIMLRHRFVLQSETRSCIGAETTSEKTQWSMRWLGPGIVVGHEGRANVWMSRRNVVVKAAGNHVRLAEVEEQLPWHDLHDSLRETDEQTYFDLSPPGVSRDRQFGGPSPSQMSQCPTSSQMSQTHLRSQRCQILCMQQRAIHECVGAQMSWDPPRDRLFHHLLCLRKMCLQPHHMVSTSASHP